MLSNPFLVSPSAASAWAEGFVKGFVAIRSPEPGETIAEADLEAFGKGVEAGAEAARSGLALDNACIPALEEHGPLHTPSVLINTAEILHGAWEARHLVSLAAGIASILVAVIELSCTLPVHMLPAEQVLPGLIQPLIDQVSAFGFDSIELFCGAGLDVSAVDCEIRLSPLFSSEAQARDAAIAMSRPEWIVVSWRTDQSNSFRVVDTNPT